MYHLFYIDRLELNTGSASTKGVEYGTTGYHLKMVPHLQANVFALGLINRLGGGPLLQLTPEFPQLTLGCLCTLAGLIGTLQLLP